MKSKKIYWKSTFIMLLVSLNLFLIFNLLGHFMVGINPVMFPTGDIEPLTDGALPTINKPYVQKMHFEILSLMYAKSLDDPGKKLLVSLGKLDCLISFETPQANSTLYILFSFLLDSYKFDTLLRNYIIQGIRLNNVSLSLSSDNYTKIVQIEENRIITIYSDDIGEFIFPITIPDNWSTAEKKYLSFKIEGLSVLTDRGSFIVDIMPVIGPFPMYYYFYDHVVYTETFNDINYFGDMGTSRILIDYHLSDLSQLEIFSLIFFCFIAFLMSMIFIPEFLLLIRKKNNFKNLDAEMKIIDSTTSNKYWKTTKFKSLFSFLQQLHLRISVLKFLL